MEELTAQVEDALSDARVPRYVRQLIQELYAQVRGRAESWGRAYPRSAAGFEYGSESEGRGERYHPHHLVDAPLGGGAPSYALGAEFGRPARPNLSTLPSIPFRRKLFPGDVAAALPPRIDAAPLSRQLQHEDHRRKARGVPPPQMMSPSASSVTTASPTATDRRATPRKSPSRDVLFSLRIDSVDGGCREVDVVSISANDRRVLLASKIVTFPEIQDIRKLGDSLGYHDMPNLPFGTKLSGDASVCHLIPDIDPALGRVCRRLAAVASCDLASLTHLFLCKLVLGSKIRWYPGGYHTRVVYVFLNEGQDGVLSLPDNGVKIRAQKGTAICLTGDVKGLEKTTGGNFPDGYKQVLIACFSAQPQ